jgi:filamentous hemagglutinin family protein
MIFLNFSYFLAAPSITTTCYTTLLMPATAQIVPDQTLGIEQSNVIPNVNIRGINSDVIDGGAIRNSNLFHSFQEFNVEAGRGAYFVNPVGIENILSRVTGNNVSNILGTLGVLGNANLFLINPNGIIFGPNARLDVGGSFFASTADSIVLGTGLEFAATDPQAPPLLTINIPMGLNFRQNPGPIVVQGAGHNLKFDPDTGATIRERPVGLQVPSGQTLALVGGDVVLEGGNLTAEAGRIELGSIAGVAQVQLPAKTGEGLSYDGVSSFGNIQLSQAASVDVSGEGGGNIQIQGRQIQFRDGGVMLADTLGSQPGGSLTVRASESLELIGVSLPRSKDTGHSH